MNMETQINAAPVAPPSPAWSSRTAFILAAVGSAVGLGNIWKFPYMAGTNGGGAFVIFYLGCILLIGVPILVAEVMIGRRGGASPMAAFAKLANEFGASRHWAKFGAAGAVIALVILSFYSVVAGWSLAYVAKFASGSFWPADGAASGAEFAALLAQPVSLVAWHSLFLTITCMVIGRGVSAGIERAVLWLMPGLFILLLLLVGYAAIEGNFAAGVRFLFSPDWSSLSSEAALSAAGHAFFTLSVGLGGLIAYGGYLPKHVSIPQTALVIAAADTACALLAGLAIFPLVFMWGLDPASGPGLLFVTLPVAIAAMPFGQFLGICFFILVAIAALTSAVAFMEPLVAILTNRGRSRPLVTASLGLLCWSIGLVSLFSFNLWSGFTPGGRTLFDWLNLLTSDILLPVGGLLIAYFAGWIVTGAQQAQEFASPRWWKLWQLLVRFVAPATIMAVLAHNLLSGS